MKQIYIRIIGIILLILGTIIGIVYYWNIYGLIVALIILIWGALTIFMVGE